MSEIIRYKGKFTKKLVREKRMKVKNAMLEAKMRSYEESNVVERKLSCSICKKDLLINIANEKQLALNSILEVSCPDCSMISDNVTENISEHSDVNVKLEVDYQEIKFADTENFITQNFDGCPQCHTFDEERQELQKRIEILEQENDELRRKLEESNEAISNQWSNLKFSVVMQNNLSDAPPPLLLLKKDESTETKRRLNREKVRRWRARQRQENLDRIRRQDAEAHRLRVKNETQEQTQARQEALRKRREKETPQQRRARQQADAEAHRLRYMLKY